jgi:hypothetical protein
VAFVSTWRRVLSARSPATQEDATLYKRPSEVGVKAKALFSHEGKRETEEQEKERKKGNDLVVDIFAASLLVFVNTHTNCVSIIKVKIVRVV